MPPSERALRVFELQKENQRLRDEFAMAALSGILGADSSPPRPTAAAKYAYGYADAMMEARKK